MSDLGAARGVARWRTVGDADTGFVISRYVSGDRVGLFLRGGRGRDGAWLAPRLLPHAAALAAALRTPFGNDRFPFDQGGPHFTGPVDWDIAIDWLEAETARYAAALTPLRLGDRDA